MPGTQILSIICVVDGRQSDPIRLLRNLHESASRIGMPFELVVVVNCEHTQLSGGLRSLTRALDSLQIYFVRRRVDYVTAVLAGLENAIGDWIATLDLARDDPGVIHDLMAAARRAGSEVAVAAQVRPRRGLV